MNTLSSLRHLLRLAEAAHAAQDEDAVRAVLAAVEVLAQSAELPIDMKLATEYVRSLTSCCEHCYMTHDAEQIADLRRQVVGELARHNESLMAAADQKAMSLAPMVRLVTAMYVRQVDGTTEGVSVALVIEADDTVRFPRQGSLIDKLQAYCAEHRPPQGNVDFWMPDQLADYRLMAGSVETQEVLAEELTVMSF